MKNVYNKDKINNNLSKYFYTKNIDIKGLLTYN